MKQAPNLEYMEPGKLPLLPESGRKCKGQCYKEGIVYLAECQICSNNQVYIGESSQTLYTRCQQHLDDYKRIRNGNQGESLSSWINDHVDDAHADIKEEFNPLKDIKWNVRSSHRDPLSRQTTEAVLIQEATENKTLTKGGGGEIQVTSLNRKGEFFCARERWTKERN